MHKSVHSTQNRKMTLIFQLRTLKSAPIFLLSFLVLPNKNGRRAHLTFIGHIEIYWVIYIFSYRFCFCCCFEYTSVIIAVSNNVIFYHELKKLEKFLFSLENNSELKQLRRRPQRRLQKTIGLMSNSSARVHHAFKYISLTSTARLRRETYTFDVLWRTWTYDDELSFLFLNLNKILKSSTPGKFTCIWHIERVQKDAIKFERTQIHFLSRFSLPSSSSSLKVPNVIAYYVTLK